MAKYYVTVGERACIMQAKNPVQAALFGFKRIAKESTKEFDAPADIRVSERGYEEHEHDTLVSTGMVMSLLFYMGDDGEQDKEE